MLPSDTTDNPLVMTFSTIQIYVFHLVQNRQTAKIQSMASTMHAHTIKIVKIVLLRTGVNTYWTEIYCRS